MVRSGLFDSNQRENTFCCPEYTSSEAHRCKLHSALDSTSPQFAWYGMVKIPTSMNSEHLDAIYTPSPQLPKI